MANTPRWGYTGLLIGVSTAVVIWVLHTIGLLAVWNGVIYDEFISWTTRMSRSEPRVLIVRSDGKDFGSEAAAVQLLDTLHDLGAQAVVFNSIPRQAGPLFYGRASELGTVVFGRRLHPLPDNPDALEVDPWPPAAAPLDLPWGVTILPPSLNGVYRSQWNQVRLDGNPLPTMEWRTMKLCASGPTAVLAQTSFFINFVGEAGSLPNVSLATALEGDLIAELVDGRVVLVDLMDGLVGLETPAGRAGPMSFAEFQGNALQTLLEGNPIRPLTGSGTLLLLVGLGIISSLLYQRVTSVAGVRLVLGLLFVCALATVLVLRGLNLWLPVGSIVVAQLGQFGLTLVFRTRMTNRALNEMRLHVLSQIKRRFFPEDAWQSDDYWDHVASMIHQTLDVRRMAFLERTPRNGSLKEVKLVNCRLQDLRQDALRPDSPEFAPSVAQGTPCRTDGIFQKSEVPEVEFLCPLTVDNDLLGIWLVAIDPAQAEALPHLPEVLEKFSAQLARLLLRKNRSVPHRSLPDRFRDWLSAEKEDQAYRELRHTADMLEQYYNVLEAVLRQVGTAMIVYDHFGRVLKANALATALLQGESLAATQVTALDFLQLVTGMDPSRARQILRAVLLDNAPAAVPAKLASQGDRQFLLRLYPLPEGHHDVPEDKPPGAGGIICELIETTSLSNLANLKGVVAERLGIELRDHLAAIEMSAALLEMDKFSEDERQSIVAAVHQKIHICMEAIDQCQKYLGRNVDAYAIDCFPLDALDVLERVCASFAARADEKAVTLQVTSPRLMEQVMASTSELEQLLTALLNLLLSDAAEKTALTIQVDDGADSCLFRFSNCGFGIPNERLQQVLASSEAPMSEEFRALQAAIHYVDNWSGRLDITSEVGAGYSAVLELQLFRLTSSASSTQPAVGHS